MRRVPALLCSLALATTLSGGALAGATAPLPQPQLVRVTLTPDFALERLLEAGFDVVDAKPGRFASVFVWPGDESRLAALGAEAVLVDANPGLTAARFADAELRANPAPPASRVRGARGGRETIQSPPPFGSGSMGGYWTSAEIKMKLDELVANDVNGVVADKLDTLGTTWQNRPIWGLRLGTTVEGPDTRPVIYYNSLNHAREPGGMQALFWFVDDLLAGYGADPEKTALLQNRVIYIVPLSNPDGYAANENTYFGGGGFGMWRKNARDNNSNGGFDSGDGVDLNRNYGFQWGFDDIGSSPSSSSDIYRGPSAFSEPESRAQRDKIIGLRPTTGLSFHTYSDLMLHPWGYQVTAAPDSNLFYEWDDQLTLRNNYMSGNSPRVLYQVNGEFNDWCYGETVLKPRYYSWTPEIGSANDGFWPPQSRILPLARELTHSCYVTAHIAKSYVRVEKYGLSEGVLNAGWDAHVWVRARNHGLTTTGAGLTAQLVPLEPSLIVYDGPIGYPVLAQRTSGDALGGATFHVAAYDTITPGRLARFQVRFTTTDGEVSCDTLAIPVGTPTVLLDDGASNAFVNFLITSGTWGIRSNDPTHPSRYFADSPFGQYTASLNARLTKKGWLDLSHGTHAYATFETRWGLEGDADAATLETSPDSVTWTPQAGTMTTLGLGGSQPSNLPCWEGNRFNWRWERVDLTPLMNAGATRIRMRFHTQSDASVQGPGFDFDSLQVYLYDPAAQPLPVAVGDTPAPAALEFAPPSPNPVSGLARFEFSLPREGHARLEVLDIAGRRVTMLVDGNYGARRYVRGWDLTDGAGRRVAPGVYLARLVTPEGERVRRVVVME